MASGEKKRKGKGEGEQQQAGSSGGVDHTFRRTWDRAEFAALAEERAAKGLGAGDSDAAGAIERAGAVPMTRQKSVAAREAGALQRELDARVNTVREVSGGIDATLRDRSAFYCELCAYGCMDSMAWLSHCNSLSHQRRTGATLAPARSNLDDVQMRLKEVSSAGGARKRPIGGADDDARLKRRREAGAAALARVRQRRGATSSDAAGTTPEGSGATEFVAVEIPVARAQSGEDGDGAAANEGSADDDDQDEASKMAALMGFAGFGTSKR
jgi:U4/U6.U5 tri-snRNP component SNU23